ncbi:MAG: glycosyltransferase family 2 protein [Acidobacteriia bacterium]|nr:glycosyltransferase family 2 protein [Terriglobia bacterium]
MPKVSVIIPVYNGGKYIAATLETVFAQTFRDFEVIVINDGSSDGTEQVLSPYRGRIVYLLNDHGGPALSRNRGLDAASGTHIAFLDADDLWHPEKLEKQVACAEAHPEYGIITTDAAVFDGTGILATSSKAGKHIPSGFVLEHLLFDNWIGTSCAMVRRECFEKVGKFDEERFVWGEDWIMWMRIAAHYPVYFLDEVLVQYRVHPQGYSRANLEKHFQDLLYDLDKLERFIPKLSARPELVREARFRLCLRSGWDDLQSLEVDRARDKLRRAVRYKPQSVKAWALLGSACVPPAILRAVKYTLKSARRMFRNHS